MATIQPLDDDLHDDSTSDMGELEAVQAAEESTPKAPPAELPSKYRGKTLEDIVRMHQEAEKLIGKQAQEVGEVRRMADELLKQQLSSRPKEVAPQQEEQQDSDLDFFEDPKKAIQKAVAKHPDVLAAKQASEQMRRQHSQAQLAQRHPDMGEVVQDGEFIEWVKASPVRLQLFAQADQQYDVAAADELLTTFKQLRTRKVQEVQDSGKKARQQDLRAAAVDVSGTGESSKKVYRRADLIKLKMTDPERYEAIQPEIMQAYAEGRVK